MKSSNKRPSLHSKSDGRIATAAAVVLGSFGLCAHVAAQIIQPPVVEQPQEFLQPGLSYPPTVAPSAAGPYFSQPTWGQTLAPNVRFVILTNFNSDAVLDRETGLVWARQSAALGTGDERQEFSVSQRRCRSLVVGSRGGWRLPIVAELLTLIDFSLPSSPVGVFRMPAGHPFVLATGQLTRYWTSDPTVGGDGHFIVSMNSGGPVDVVDDDRNFALCVRGPS